MTSLSGLWQQPRLRPTWNQQGSVGQMGKGRMGHSNAVERWTSPCLGRYLPRHLCPFTPAAGHQRSRCCSRPGRTEENSNVHRAGCYTPLRTSGHRVHGSFWTPGTCLLPRAWPSHQGGNRGSNPYPSTIYTNELQWPSSGGMQPRCWAPPHPETLTQLLLDKHEFLHGSTHRCVCTFYITIC